MISLTILIDYMNDGQNKVWYKMRFFLSFFLCNCSFLSFLIAQEAQDSLYEYLIEAEGKSDSYCAYYVGTRIVSLGTDETTLDTNFTGYSSAFVESGKDVQLFSLDLSRIGKIEVPMQIETGYVNGRVYRRFHSLGAKHPGKEIELDKTGNRRFMDRLGWELDPYGLPLSSIDATQQQSSNLQQVLNHYTKVFSLKEERRVKNRLIGVWESANRVERRTITFNDDFGSKPVEVVVEAIRSNGEIDKRFASVIKTDWKKVEDEWLPVGFSCKGHTGEKEIVVEIEFEWLNKEYWKEYSKKLKSEKLLREERPIREVFEHAFSQFPGKK